MTRPPVLGINQPPSEQEKAALPREESVVQKAGDSPLATQLPAWDLLPAHTLLIRRRPLKK